MRILRPNARRATHRRVVAPISPLVPALVVALALGAGCASGPAPDVPAPGSWMPRLVEGETIDIDVDAGRVRRLQLISINLVSALVQLPGMDPGNVTLQLSRPATAYGLVLVRTLEDAGYGLQQVSADQGRHYLSYRRRVAETDAGEVVDYGLSVGRISLDREYSVRDGRVFPSSLLTLVGVESMAAVQVDDEIFREQGGGVAFVSGVRDESGAAARDSVSEVAVADYDEVPFERRAGGLEFLDRARALGATNEPAVSLDALERLRRTVLIFDDPATRMLGRGNKQAVRLLVRGFLPEDVFVITACTDADGRDDAAEVRGLRVREEFTGYGVPGESIRLAPCTRASYRHPSDDSPVPVEIVQYRKPA